MGSNQSVRSTHFSRPLPKPPQFDEPEDSHISISNKMVERLVEDATIAGGAAASVPVPAKQRGDYKEKIFMEKIKCLDESHSERSKITVDDLNSLARRIEMRTANMIALDPVCAESRQQVIDCYNESDAVEDVVKCWNTIESFSKCVQEASATRLRARTARDARELARRERHVAHAREHALRELRPPQSVES